MVDDDRDTRESLRDVLESEGYAVEDAANGRAALNYLTSDAAEPAIVLLDLRMPDMSGWKLVELLRSTTHYCALPIIVISAEQPQAADGLVLTDYFQKPVNVAALLEAVSRALKPPRRRSRPKVERATRRSRSRVRSRRLRSSQGALEYVR